MAFTRHSPSWVVVPLVVATVFAAASLRPMQRRAEAVSTPTVELEILGAIFADDVTNSFAATYLGDRVFAFATVVHPVPQDPHPTGTVSFTTFASEDCSGTPIRQETKAIPQIPGINIAEARTDDLVVYQALAESGISYQAHYNGDSDYDPADSTCVKLYAGATPPLVTWSNTVLPPAADSLIIVGPADGSYTGVPPSTLRIINCVDTCPSDANLWVDGDHDALPDLVEFITGTDRTRWDTDSDGLNDMEENAFGTDPFDADMDDDGDGTQQGPRTDAVDNCPAVPNPNQADADGDTIGDACDANPEASDLPGGANADGDGLAAIKGYGGQNQTLGSAAVVSYGFTGTGGCSAAEEAANGTSDANPRDFFDVDNSGKVDATDIFFVRYAFGAISGKPHPQWSAPWTFYPYVRARDLSPASAAGGKGDGKINAVDVALVRSQFNRSCTGAP